MPSCPQKPYKENDHGNQNRRKQGRPCPRVLGCSAFMYLAFISTHAFRLSDTPCQLQDQEVQDHANEVGIHQHPGKNDHIRVIFFVQIFHSGRVPYLPLQSQSLRIYFTRPSTSSVVRVEPQWGINADLLMDGPPSLMTPLRYSSERFSISEELVKLRGSVAKSFVTLIPLPLPSIP